MTTSNPGQSLRGDEDPAPFSPGGKRNWWSLVWFIAAAIVGAFVGGLTVLFWYVSARCDDVIRQRSWARVGAFFAYVALTLVVGVAVFCGLLSVL
jgi:hypothetical protein